MPCRADDEQIEAAVVDDARGAVRKGAGAIIGIRAARPETDLERMIRAGRAGRLAPKNQPGQYDSGNTSEIHLDRIPLHHAGMDAAGSHRPRGFPARSSPPAAPFVGAPEEPVRGVPLGRVSEDLTAHGAKRSSINNINLL